MDKNELYHYRTPGSKNGIRLYQYKDGSLTPAGRIHYGVGEKKNNSTNSNKSDHTKNVNDTNGQFHSSNDKKQIRNDQSDLNKSNKNNDKKQNRNDQSDLNESNKNNDYSKISVKDLSDRDLQKAISRLQSEETYNQLVNKANYKPETFTQKFTKNLKNSIARDLPDLISTLGKQYAQNALNDYINANKSADKRAREQKIVNTDPFALDSLTVDELKTYNAHKSELYKARGNKNYSDRDYLEARSAYEKGGVGTMTTAELGALTEYNKSVNAAITAEMIKSFNKDLLQTDSYKDRDKRGQLTGKIKYAHSAPEDGISFSSILALDVSALEHHGTKGQKWGFRRYQNPDGSLTDAGKARYGKGIKDGNNKELGAYINRQVDLQNKRNKHINKRNAYAKAAGVTATITAALYASLGNTPVGLLAGGATTVLTTGETFIMMYHNMAAKDANNKSASLANYYMNKHSENKVSLEWAEAHQNDPDFLTKKYDPKEDPTVKHK